MAKKTLASAEDVQVAFLLVWNKFLEEHVDEFNNPETFKKMKDLNDEINSLREIGLGGSKNTEMLVNLKKEYDSKKLHNETLKETHEFVKFIRNNFPKAVMLPYDKFYELLEQFNLMCGPIDSYKGLIPQENIDDIKVVTDTINRLDKGEVKKFDPRDPYEYFGGKSKSNPFTDEFNKNFLNITKIVLDKEWTKSETDIVINQVGRIPYIMKGRSLVDSLGVRSALSSHYRVNTSGMDKKSWIIVAPSHEIQDNVVIEIEQNSDFSIKPKVEDPLLCKFTKYGVVIFSAWGEEANADIYQKFKID